MKGAENMEIVGYVAIAALIVAAGVGVAMTVRSFPDLRRYLAMKRM